MDVVIALSKQPLNDPFSEDSAQLLSWGGAVGALVHSVLLNTCSGPFRLLRGRILQLLHSKVCPALESLCQDLRRVACLSTGCRQQSCIVISVWMHLRAAEHGKDQSQPMIILTGVYDGVTETSDTSVSFKRLNAYPSTWFAELANNNAFPSSKESWKKWIMT